MKSKSKKLLSTLLTAVMVFGMFAVMPLTANAAVSFWSHPSDCTVAEGQNATFTVIVMTHIANTVTMQWQIYRTTPFTGWFNLSNTSSTYSGVTDDTLTVLNVTAAMSGNRYRCEITDSSGTVSSNEAKLIVTSSGPKIDVQPVNKTIKVGESTTVSVQASGVGPLTYQWQVKTSVSWHNIPTGDIFADTYSGVTTPTLSITIPEAKLSYEDLILRCAVTNAYGTVYSDEAKITVTNTPAITGPATMTLTEGYAATSTGVYTVTGIPAPTITKTSGDVKITWNNTTKKLDIAAGLAAGTYPVVLTVTNSAGTATFTFTLTVTEAGTPPSIAGSTTMTLPEGYAAASTDAYTITGNPAPTVTKTSGNAAITWNNTTKKLDVAAGLAAGTYPVVLTVSNSAGTATLTFTLTVTAASTPTFIVTFNSNGGSAVTSQSVASGGKAAKPVDPTITGYIFAGWYVDSGLTVVYNFDTAVMANLTLYAKWTATSIPSAGSMSNFVKKRTYTFGMFTDVNENEWYGYNNVNRVIANAYEYGLMQGDSVTTFKPTGNITIAEAVTVAARVHSIYMTGAESFTASDPWYKVYVDYAITNGIIVSNDFTDYTKPATRAEMAYIFSRSLPAAEFTTQNTVNSLPDVNNGTPYRDAIFMLYKAGILAGNDDLGTFNPGNNITRAEAAAIISRVILPASRLSGKTFG